METTGFFTVVLGVTAPWQIREISLSAENRRVDVWLEHVAGQPWSCPEVGCREVSSLTVRDHAAERLWRHLDCGRYETYLHARIPRVFCPDHGVRQTHVPWAHPDSRMTKDFERVALAILQECRVSGSAAVLGLSWDEAQGIRDRERRRRQERGFRAHGR